MSLTFCEPALLLQKVAEEVERAADREAMEIAEEEVRFNPILTILIPF